MATDVAEVWRDCFRNWPAEVARRGVIVTTLNEQIPFENFLSGENVMLFERRTPDTVGARMVLVPYQNLAALKIVDVLKAKAFSHLGFAPGPPSK